MTLVLDSNITKWIKVKKARIFLWFFFQNVFPGSHNEYETSRPISHLSVLEGYSSTSQVSIGWFLPLRKSSRSDLLCKYCILHRMFPTAGSFQPNYFEPTLASRETPASERQLFTVCAINLVVAFPCWQLLGVKPLTETSREELSAHLTLMHCETAKITCQRWTQLYF